MPFEPQDVLQVHKMVVGSKKQTTYGTALLAASYDHVCRFDGGAFARIAKEFRTDLDRAGKGHPWATERQAIQQQTAFSSSGLEVEDYLAGWACVWMFSKVTTTGAGPYTHTFIFENVTNQSPVTSIYFTDTADIKYQLVDLAMSELEFSGTEKGPLQMQFSMVGSGRTTEGAVSAADSLALPTTNTYLLGSDTDILIGPVGTPVSIKERVRGWNIRISQDIKPNYSPGGGLFSTFTRMGPQRVTLGIQVAAKDTDDIRTLFLNDTLREVQINTLSSTKALNFTFKGVYLSALSLGLDGNEEVWSLEADEQSIIKNGANEVLTAVVIDSQATWLTAG